VSTEDTPTLHILRTPMEEVARRSEGERWCFRCRKRREFVYVVTRPIVRSLDDTGSWYGPTHQIECTICRAVDGDCFPGTEREWA
jgi:hypothetical protein